MRQFVTTAQADGVVVFAGAARVGTQDIPFAAFTDTFEDHADELRTILRGDMSPKEMSHAVGAVLERLEYNRAVLVLDDLHNADAASLRLVASLLRRPPKIPLMFVLGYRDRLASVDLQVALNSASPKIPVTSLRLRPLSEQVVDGMLAGHGPATWRARMHRSSGGNPAYLRALLAEQAALDGSGTTTEISGTAFFEYAPFLSELAALSPATREVAEAAAVVEPDFDAELLARMLDRPEQSVLHAIGDLVSRELVRPAVHGSCFAFRHPVVRRAIYHSSELSARVALHVAADNALRTRGAAAAERAVHVEQWANHGDLDAVDVLDEAASSAERTEPERAVAWLTAALRLLPQRADLSERRARLLIRLAKARGMCGHLRECRDLMHEALRLLPTEHPTEHAEAVAFTATVQRLLGAHAETDALLRAEIAKVDDDTPAAAALKFELACGQLKTGDSAACRFWAEQALIVARRVQDRPMQAACLALLAKAWIGDGDGAAAGYLDEASAMLDAMLDDEFGRSLDAVEWIGWGEIMLGRWDNALRHIDKAIEFAVRADQRLTLPRLLLAQVFALHTRGRLAEASRGAEFAVELAERSGCTEQLYIARTMRLWNDTLTGASDGSPAAGMVSAGQPREVVSSWRDTLSLRLLAEALLTMGDHKSALALVDVLGGADLPGCPGYTRVAWYEVCTRAELAAGRVDEAAKWAELAVAVAASLGQPSRTGLAMLARAQVLLAHEPQAAFDSACEAVSRLEEAGVTLDTLRARQVMGIALSYQDQNDAAVRQLKSVRQAFEKLGATVLARRAGTDQRKVAARGSRGSGKDAVAAETAELLTTRERQVAGLVREGLTNRLIARRLYISEKTVEMHLSRVFTKLGVPSRAALAALVTRECRWSPPPSQ